MQWVLQNKRDGEQCDASVVRIKVYDISECSLIFGISRACIWRLKIICTGKSLENFNFILLLWSGSAINSSCSKLSGYILDKNQWRALAPEFGTRAKFEEFKNNCSIACSLKHRRLSLSSHSTERRTDQCVVPKLPRSPSQQYGRTEGQPGSTSTATGSTPFWCR